MSLRVTILAGGASSERDVSLASAVQVVAALRQCGHQVSVVDTARGFVPEREEASLLPAAVGTTPPNPAALADLERRFLLSGLQQLREVQGADVLFLALHGGWGEDGTLQALLEITGIPYTGSGALGSGLAMDKDVSKRLFSLAGIPTPAWRMTPVTAATVDRELQWPVVVKPSREGSTVGLSVVHGREGLEPAVRLAATYDQEVMVEKFVPGRELTVGILDGAALPTGEIIPRHEIFDYECKYTPGMSQEVFPADLPEAVDRECGRLALAAHKTLKLGGYSRVDFRMAPDSSLYCLEANTLPGLTSASLLPQAARAAGISFPELCERICRTALRPERQHHRTED